MTTRAKMQVLSIVPYAPDQGRHQEEVHFSAVCGNVKFGPNGENEDNSYARWTPTGSMKLAITNPNLYGAFKEGKRYYVDITEAHEGK